MDPGGTKVPGDGVVDSNDPTFHIAHDLQGRRIATFRGTDTYAKETYFHHPESVKGPAFAGGPIVRDRNGNCWQYFEYAMASVAADSSRAERYYYVPDSGGNIVALVTAGGALAEQYRYSATGVPYGIPLGDTTGKGYVSSTTTSSKDYQQAKYIQDYKSINGYKVRGDLNLDGKLDGDDLAIVSAKDGSGLGRGLLSAMDKRNLIVSLMVGYQQELLLSPSDALRPSLSVFLSAAEYAGFFDAPPPTIRPVPAGDPWTPNIQDPDLTIRPDYSVPSLPAPEPPTFVPEHLPEWRDPPSFDPPRRPYFDPWQIDPDDFRRRWEIPLPGSPSSPIPPIIRPTNPIGPMPGYPNPLEPDWRPGYRPRDARPSWPLPSIFEPNRWRDLFRDPIRYYFPNPGDVPPAKPPRPSWNDPWAPFRPFFPSRFEPGYHPGRPSPLRPFQPDIRFNIPLNSQILTNG